MLRILVLHVLIKALPLFFIVLLGIVVQPVLYGAPEHIHRVQVTIGFCNNLSVDASGGMACRGTVVFNRLLHDAYLLGGKPFPQPYIRGKYLSASDMMDGSWAAEA